MRTSDLGLVTIAVDSSIIGANGYYPKLPKKENSQYYLDPLRSKNTKVDIRNQSSNYTVYTAL